MKNYEAKILLKNKYLLAESPFYDERTKLVSFVDIIAGEFFIFPENDISKLKKISMGQQIGSLVPMKEPNNYLACATDGLYVWNGDNLDKLLDTTSYFKSYERSNDCKADPMGRLFFGSSVYVDGKDPSGNLFCYDNGNIFIEQSDTKISNGMAWSKDRTKFYFSDSPYGAIFEYDYDINTGKISNRKVLFEISDGTPDGMCIDSDDNLWVAIWGGRRIEHRDSKTGELLSVVNVPANNVTSCCFFGENKNTLFITTSGDGQEGEFDGSLFTVDVDSTGTLTDYFNP